MLLFRTIVSNQEARARQGWRIQSLIGNPAEAADLGEIDAL